MNANELADALEIMNRNLPPREVKQAAAMLRQLQKEHNGLCNLVFEYQDKTDELRAENEVLREKIKHLESQVYGGSTK